MIFEKHIFKTILSVKLRGRMNRALDATRNHFDATNSSIFHNLSLSEDDTLPHQNVECPIENRLSKANQRQTSQPYLHQSCVHRTNQLALLPRPTKRNFPKQLQDFHHRVAHMGKRLTSTTKVSSCRKYD